MAMRDSDLGRRLEQLSRRLDELELVRDEKTHGTAVVGELALDTSVGLGELLRRRGAVRRARLEEVLVRIVARARGLLTPARLGDAIEALRLDGLGEAQRVEPDGEDAERSLAASFLEARERAEALLWTIHEGGTETALAAPLGKLRKKLDGLDRLGRAKLRRLLLLNKERRRVAAELDPEAAADWWWSLRAGCPEKGLFAAAAAAALTAEHLAHLAECADCREDSAWLARIDRLLGGTPEGHLSSAQLSAYAAGELTSTERGHIAKHLQGCPGCRELQHAARAGIEEAERIERGQHRSFAIASPSEARALAATAEPEPAPERADRRVLLEGLGLYRAIYFREGWAGRVGFFAEHREELELDLELLLDGAQLKPLVTESEALVFELGKVVELGGRTLTLRVRRAGELIAERSFTLIQTNEEDAAEDEEEEKR